MRRAIAVAVIGAVAASLGFAAPAHADSSLPSESFDNLALCDDTTSPDPTHGQGELCFVPAEYGIGEWVIGDSGQYRIRITEIEHCEHADSAPSPDMAACYWDAEYMSGQGDNVLNLDSGTALQAQR